MEAFEGVGMKNRYSCFLLMNEDDVEDVSVDKFNDLKKKKVSSNKVKVDEGVSQKVDQIPAKKTSNIAKKVGEVRADIADSIPGVSRQMDDASNSNIRQVNKGGKGDNNPGPKRVSWNQPKDMPSGDVEEKVDSPPEKPDEVEIRKSDEENVEKVEEVDESKFMTLDEWKALQQPREKPVFNLRKAGEGEDQSQWTKMVLKKDDVEEEQSEEYETFDYDHPQRAGRCKTLKLDCLFEAIPREQGHGHGDRDMRVSGRDRRGGFNNRRNAYSEAVAVNKSAPRVDDMNDFPSLG